MKISRHYFGATNARITNCTMKYGKRGNISASAAKGKKRSILTTGRERLNHGLMRATIHLVALCEDGFSMVCPLHNLVCATDKPFSYRDCEKAIYILFSGKAKPRTDFKKRDKELAEFAMRIATGKNK